MELVAAMGIAAIVLAAALPSFQRMLSDNRRTATVNQLVASAALARQTAIKHNRSVTLCPRGNDNRCSGDWHQGWMVILEPPDWKPNQPIPHEALVDIWERPPAGVTIIGNRARFRFRPSRMRATNGTWVVCAGPHAASTSIIVAPTGRVRTERQTTACPG